jgi:hypothetical protein
MVSRVAAARVRARVLIARVLACVAVAACTLAGARAATAGDLAPRAAPGTLAPRATGPLTPLLTTTELVAGSNRFAFVLLRDGSLLAGADVTVRTYDVSAEDAELVAVTPAVYHALEVIDRGRHVHIHPDGTAHLHSAATDVHGIYVAQVKLDRPGPWGVEIVARHGDGIIDGARLRVAAVATTRTPQPGMPAPRSRNLVASDVGDLRQIDTSDPPDPRLHQTRIADAIRQGRPQVIVFATPKFCTSRVCGPVLDVVRTLIPDYGKRVAFVHQEIWQPGGMERLAPTVEEWNLRSEPWTFVVDGDGIVRVRFEGVMTRRELEAALQQVLRGK